MESACAWFKKLQLQRVLCAHACIFLPNLYQHWLWTVTTGPCSLCISFSLKPSIINLPALHLFIRHAQDDSPTHLFLPLPVHKYPFSWGWITRLRRRHCITSWKVQDLPVEIFGRRKWPMQFIKHLVVNCRYQVWFKNKTLHASPLIKMNECLWLNATGSWECRSKIELHSCQSYENKKHKMGLIDGNQHWLPLKLVILVHLQC